METHPETAGGNGPRTGAEPALRTGASDQATGRPGIGADQRVNRFAAELRAAVLHRGLSLDRICHRLAARGVGVSAATLSYWQRGRTVPERETSLRAVSELESILSLRTGALLDLLPPQRPRNGLRAGLRAPEDSRRLWGPDSWQEQAFGEHFARLNEDIEVVSTREVLHFDSRGCLYRLTQNHLIRAVDDGAHRMFNLHAVDNPVLHRVNVRAHCGQLDQLRWDPASGSVLVSFGFGRALLRGETAVVDYEIHADDPVRASDCHEYGVRTSQGAYLLHLYFHPDRVPTACRSYYRRNAQAERSQQRPLALGASHSVHFHRARCESGYHGVTWTWPDHDPPPGAARRTAPAARTEPVLVAAAAAPGRAYHPGGVTAR